MQAEGLRVDTSVFGIDHLVTLLPDGGPATWDGCDPGSLVTAVVRQLYPGGVHDVGTPDGRLALLAKVLVPAQPATAWTALPAHAAQIRENAHLNAADIEVTDLADFAAGPSACLIIVRSPAHLSPALAGNPHAILLLNTGAEAAPGYSVVGLDSGGAATLLVRDTERDITADALATGTEALAQRADPDVVPAQLANRSVESALRLVAKQQQEVDRARDQMRSARDACEAMRQSRSWRMTRFLRRLRRR